MDFLVHPEDAAAQSIALQHMVREQGQGEREFRVIATSGLVRHDVCRRESISSGYGRELSVVGINMDVSERKLRNARVEETQQAA